MSNSNSAGDRHSSGTESPGDYSRMSNSNSAGDRHSSGTESPGDYDDNHSLAGEEEDAGEMRAARGGRGVGDHSETSGSDDGEYDGEHWAYRSETSDSGDDDEGIDPDEGYGGSERFVLDLAEGIRDGEIEEALRRASKDAARDDATRTGRSASADWEWRRATAMRNLKAQLQRSARVIGSGPAETGVLPRLHLGSPDPYAPVVPHRHSLTRFWGRLSEELEWNPHLRFCSVMVGSVHLTREMVELLASSLRGRVQDTLLLVNNRLCGEGIAMLSTLVEGNPSLRALCLRGNPIGDRGAIARLAGALRTHPALSCVNLYDCGIGNNLDIISTVLDCGVKSIGLSENGISSMGAARISKYLETNPPIGRLSLDNNAFNDDDAILFARALRRNTRLQELHLEQNNFTSLGVKLMLTAIFDSSSLNAISDSNHACSLSLLPLHYPMQVRIGNINGEDGVRRTKKMLFALHARESLLRYLEDVPVQLMPNVLAFAQAEEDRRKLINTIYTTMRWWNMPCLYAHHAGSSLNNFKRKRECIEQPYF